MKKNRETIYKELYNGWTQGITGVDRLIGNHVIAVAAAVGVIPFWYLDHYEKAQESPSIRGFLKDKNLKTTKESAYLLLRSLQISANNTLGVDWEERTTENVICKVRRILGEKNDNQWKDHHVMGLPIFLRKKGKVFILYPGCKAKTFAGSLIKSWAFNGMWLDRSALYNEIEDKLISQERYEIPRGFGKASNTMKHHVYNFLLKTWH